MDFPVDDMITDEEYKDCLDYLHEIFSTIEKRGGSLRGRGGKRKGAGRPRFLKGIKTNPIILPKIPAIEFIKVDTPFKCSTNRYIIKRKLFSN